MRLKFAISFVESTYQIISLFALVGIVASFFVLKGAVLIITIIAVLIVFTLIFFLKLKMINFYLNRCKYPYEFLSVLEQLELMDDLEISWSREGARNSNHLTKQFLDDNNLVTEIGKRKIDSPFIIFMCFASVVAFVYFGYKDPFPGKSLLMVILIIWMALSFYFLARMNRRSNDTDPILIFNEKALFYEDQKIAWNKIDSWKVKDGPGESERYIVINYNDIRNVKEYIKVPLHNLNIDRIDALLLLTHFKTKYENADNRETGEH